MTNFSAVLYGRADLRIEDRPKPVPGLDEVLVRVHAVGVCGSDIHYYEHGRIGSYIVDSPIVLGHESSGVIVDVGDRGDRSRIGQKVALEPGIPCRSCEQCLAGRYNLCPKVRFFATPPVDGSFSEYVVIDAAFAHPAPENLDFEQAAMAEPVSVGVWASRKARVGLGDRVLVTGAGPIGLLAAQVARAFGSQQILVTDISDYRLKVAAALGFDVLPADQIVPGAFDVMLESSGSPAALTSGMNSLAPAGRVVLIGSGADTANIDIPLIQTRELSISGVFRYANTYPAALALISCGEVNVADIITHRFPLDQALDALTIGKRDSQSLKSIVLPQKRGR